MAEDRVAARVYHVPASELYDEPHPNWRTVEVVRVSDLQSESAATTLRLVALALLTINETDADNAVPQSVWDGLHEDGLVQTGQDFAGDGMTYLTTEGHRALVEGILSAC